VGELRPRHDAQRIVTLYESGAWDRRRRTLEVLVCLLARGHILLEGVPGTAKTLMVRTARGSRSMCGFVRIQFTPT